MTGARMTAYFKDYESFHQTRGNKITHYAGIPMIVFSTFGFLSIWGATVESVIGIILMILIAAFYVSLQPMWGTLFTIVVAAFYTASQYLPLQWHIILFVLGWILQGLGHYKYEKKSPAFLQNLNHLLIGPFWIFYNLVSKPRAQFPD